MKTIFILLDSWREDEIDKMDFIRSLKSKSMYGSVKSLVGYGGHLESIFSGKDIEEHGFWFNIMKSRNSKLKWLSYFDVKNRLIKKFFSYLNILVMLLRGESYLLRLYNFDFRSLKYFDFSKRRLTCLENNLFRELKDNGKRFWYFNYPFSYDKKKKLNFFKYSDKKVMEILKRKLKENYDFYFVHLLGLDKVGHEYGLGMERLEKLKEIDLLIKDVFNENYNLVIVGDHGMYDVKGTVNVKKEVEKLNTKCLMFLDSSVARFWFLEDKKRVKECLEGLGMKVLEEKDYEKYKARMKDERYGELIGICKKGILIFPNSYDEKIVKGMHGYLDENPGFLSYRGEGERKLEFKDFYRILKKKVWPKDI